MRKEYSFITTYYDDVITEGGGDFCGRYAQSVDTIRATYCGAVFHYYRERARIESDDPRGISPDFYIKKFYRVLFRDFRYKVVDGWECTRAKTFYRLAPALREVIRNNARNDLHAMRGILNAMTKIKSALLRARSIDCTLDFWRRERQKVRFDFS